MSKFHLAVLIVLLYLPVSLRSQSRSEKLFREYNSFSYLFSPRLQYFTQNQSFFFYEGSTVFDQNYPVGHSFPLNSISEIHNSIGYEHKASDKWYLGISGKLTSRFARTIPSYRINVTHVGNIKSLKFFQEVALQYIDNPKSDNPNIIISDDGSLSFYFKLLKRFTVSDSKFIDAYIGYRPSIYFDYVNDGFTAYDTRTIDFTRGFVGVNFSLTNTFLLGLFTARETTYYYRIETTGPNGIQEAGKVNSITHLLGLNLIYIFKMNREIPGEAPYYYFKF